MWCRLSYRLRRFGPSSSPVQPRLEPGADKEELRLLVSPGMLHSWRHGNQAQQPSFTCKGKLADSYLARSLETSIRAQTGPPNPLRFWSFEKWGHHTYSVSLPKDQETKGSKRICICCTYKICSAAVPAMGPRRRRLLTERFSRHFIVYQTGQRGLKSQAPPCLTPLWGKGKLGHTF